MYYIFKNNSPPLSAGERKRENSVRGTHIAYLWATFPSWSTYLTVSTTLVDQQTTTTVHHPRVWFTLSANNPFSIKHHFKAEPWITHSRKDQHGRHTLQMAWKIYQFCDQKNPLHVYFTLPAKGPLSTFFGINLFLSKTMLRSDQELWSKSGLCHLRAT